MASGKFDIWQWIMAIGALTNSGVDTVLFVACLCRRLSKVDSGHHHRMSRRFFDPKYTGHPDDLHDVALYEEAQNGYSAHETHTTGIIVS